jgi:hypothetical protein
MRLPRDVLRRHEPVPVAFEAIVETIARRFAEAPRSGRLGIGLDNSLVMAPYIDKAGDAFVAVIDWALVERILMFSQFLWGSFRAPNHHQRLVSYLEREILLLAARKAACRHVFIAGRDYHRGYRNSPLAEILTSPVNLDGQLVVAQQLAETLVQRQIAKAVLLSDPDAASRHLIGALRHGLRVDPLDERLRTDLFVDSLVLDNVSRIDPTAVAQGLLGVTALAIAYDEIDAAVEAVASGFGGLETALDQRIMAEESRNYDARLSQIESVARTSAALQDDRMRRYLEGMAGLAALLRQVVADVMVDGLQALHTHFWDEPLNVRNSIIQSVIGLSTEDETFILHTMCAEGAEADSAAWAAIDIVPEQVWLAPLPGFNVLPGAGRPHVADWRERLADAGLRDACQAVTGWNG